MPDSRCRPDPWDAILVSGPSEQLTEASARGLRDSSPRRGRAGPCFPSTIRRARGQLSAVHVLSTGVVIVVAVVALAATLGASEVLVRGAGRLARNLGLLGGAVGLIVALGADSPEISSSVSAVASGSAATAAGVVFGSNVFNIAVLLGGAALAAGEVRIHRSVVVVDAGVAIVVTLAMGLAVLGEIPIAVAWSLMLLVFIPYVTFLFLSPASIARLPLPSRISAFLVSASREAGVEGMDIEAELEDLAGARGRSWLPVALIIPALGVIVLGSIALVGSAITLGQRWGVASVIIGVVALAATTSLPNAYAAVRLATDGRGAAVVSATYNSNTLNLVAGIAVPILVFPSLRGAVPASYVVWLLAMSGLALILLARGLRRGGAVVLLSAYAAFVVYALLTA